MAKKKLPHGFQTWVELYQFIMKEVGDVKKIVFKTMNIEDQRIESYSVTMDTVKKYCWEEVQGLLMDNETKYALKSLVLHSSFDVELKEKIYKIL